MNRFPTWLRPLVRMLASPGRAQGERIDRWVKGASSDVAVSMAAQQIARLADV